MLEIVSRGFKSAKESLTGRTTLDEANIKEALRQVRLSLLEADVAFPVVKRFLQNVEDKAIGELVTTRVKHKGSSAALRSSAMSTRKRFTSVVKA